LHLEYLAITCTGNLIKLPLPEIIISQSIMVKNSDKPTPEAKALSLFLMAFKPKNPDYKEKLKRINRQWDLVKHDELDNNDYQKEVKAMLDSFGGYDKVIEKTVQHYINTTGEWNQKGDDKYCVDSKKIADQIFVKRKGK